MASDINLISCIFILPHATLFTKGKGFCDAEFDQLASGEEVYWPETKAGDEPISQQCPGNGTRTVTRECDQTGNWTTSDYRTCRTFDEIQTQIVSSHASLLYSPPLSY